MKKCTFYTLRSKIKNFSKSCTKFLLNYTKTKLICTKKKGVAYYISTNIIYLVFLL